MVPTAAERAEEIRSSGLNALALKPTPKSNHQPGLVSVKKWQRMIVYRGDQVHRVSRPGLRLVMPLLERARVVDLREHIERFPIMKYVTQDGVQVNLRLVVYYRFIPDYAEQIVGEEQEYGLWTQNQVWKVLDSTLASLSLAVAQEHKEYIQNEVLRRVNKQSRPRGIDITAVTLGEVQPV